jgi:hypothetical protein
MKPSSLWIILIRIISVNIILGAIFQIPQTFTYASSLYGNDRNMPLVLVLLIFWIGFIFFLYRFGILFPDKIVKWMKLDTRFEEERFQFDLNQKSMIQASIIVISGLLFMDNFVSTIQELIIFAQQTSYELREYPNLAILIGCIIKTSFAYFLVFNSSNVSDFILKKSEK